MKNKVDMQIANGLVVSCQALPHEPLHSSYIMSRMAVAAMEGGASGIRANTTNDIQAIREVCPLPVIGIIKEVYGDHPVFITPTMKEIDALVQTGVEIIAMDATCRPRPDGSSLDELFAQAKEKYPNQLFMADCSTIEEALHADALGFDYIGTTLVGYTEESCGDKIEANDFEIIRTILANVSHSVIAEGNIDTPEKCRRVLELGCKSVVVGSIITRPQLITRRFADAIASGSAALHA